jgi:hypothetical protein
MIRCLTEHGENYTFTFNLALTSVGLRPLSLSFFTDMTIQVSEVQPVTGHEGPQGEQKYSSTVSLGARWGLAGQRHDPEKRRGTHCTGGWVGPKACLEDSENLASPEFDPWTVHPVANRCTD